MHYKSMEEANGGFAAAAPTQGDGGKVVKLRCSVKTYDWGRIGPESTVARLYERNSGLQVEEGKPYAEFWMGTHESGPSFVVVDSPAENGVAENGGITDTDTELLSLKDWIEQSSEIRCLLGDKVYQEWGPNLPFLFKVLSVEKALSIQAHPDKELAKILHKTQPNIYKDANHKPEMALALTKFEALCGFVSPEELKDVFHNVPEIAEVVGRPIIERLLQMEEVEKSKEVLELIFTALMSASKDAIAQALSRLISRLIMKEEARELTEKEQLVLRLEKQYPADIGVLAAFLFNHIKLNPGQALYLGANEPHAYIYGECIECMATSDNVVRAGLTPKARDVPTLCSMLTYKQVILHSTSLVCVYFL
ncbi:OLC1v1010741C1 [Oldenlandia corymbosa var. corymbosa]|uniref:mannose-6-phosphate isomerase n=1 Tax=Oldenlandia corymbosa var. corymbosa TaxID=529605 RepID=A0AAV1DS17_OLDCO|nr:OLC1v1010741C1 [Oldenlandia corymbosa var. corymbosa]